MLAKKNAYGIYFSEELEVARDDLYKAETELYDLAVQADIAENRSLEAQAEYNTAYQELEEVSEQFDNKSKELEEIQEAINALPPGDPDLPTHQKDLDRVQNELAVINETLIPLTYNVTVLAARVNETQADADDATMQVEKQDVVVQEAKEEVSVKESAADIAQEQFQVASARYNEALMNWQERSVPTYVRCMSDGSWFVPGNPFCKGKRPTAAWPINCSGTLK